MLISDHNTFTVVDDFVLDTGCQKTSLLLEDANDLNLSVEDMVSAIMIDGGTSHATEGFLAPCEIELVNGIVHYVDAFVSDTQEERLLGMDILQHLFTEVDGHPKRLS